MYGKILDITAENIRDKVHVCYCELSIFLLLSFVKNEPQQKCFPKKNFFSEIFSRAAMNS